MPGGAQGRASSQSPLIHHGQWAARSAVLLRLSPSLLGCDFSRSHEGRTFLETAAPVPPPHLWYCCRSGSWFITGRAPGLSAVEVGWGARERGRRRGLGRKPARTPAPPTPHPPSRLSPHTSPRGPCALTLSPHGPPLMTPARHTRASGPRSRPADESPPEKDCRFWFLTKSLAGPAFSEQHVSKRLGRRLCLLF